MGPGDYIVTVGAIAGLIVGIATLVRELSAWRSGVRSRETETRRDTVADRESLIDQLQEENTRLRGENMRLDEALRIEREHTQDLRDWIYRGKGPPPPARPTP